MYAEMAFGKHLLDIPANEEIDLPAPVMSCQMREERKYSNSMNSRLVLVL